MDYRGLPSNPGSSGTGFLKPEKAREILFERILDQLADSSLFSTGLSPTIFIVYAHNNEEEGNAYDECVRKLIAWLERIHAQILSDHSSLPPFVPRIEGTDPDGNILGNQMCLLPATCYGAETPQVRTVDKVIVCGSAVLEAYCREPSAWAYTNEIARICTYSAGQPTRITLESAIRERVEKECGSNYFHHVLTELAFLQARKSGLPDTHNMVPVVLSQAKPDQAPMQYLPVFWNTDVKLKLSSPATVSSLHKLFFKLLKRLFPDDKEFIQPFRECYDLMIEDLGLGGDTAVTQDEFDRIANRHITKAYQRYWKLFCTVIRDGKLQAYTGKLSHQVSQVLEDVAQSTQHEILEWLSPNPAPNHHGKYHDLGTSRMEGTCDWIIRDEEFRRWYSYEGSALLFLCGKMGTGKTYSTSRVIDWVETGLKTNANDEGFAYFYCNKQDLSRFEPKEILRNIIRQLATGPWKGRVNKTAVHKTVYELWHKDRERGILSTFAEWEACLLELIDTYPRTTIVLDALDECTIGKRQALINLLVKLATRGSQARPVKIFVAARPEDDIRRHLGENHVILMQDKHNAEDIESFIRARISDHPRWSRMSRDFQREVVNALLEKSGDMFLFASLQIQRLLTCDTQIALRKRLATLPDSLKTTYEAIIQTATSDPDEGKLLNRALQWVMCSARPLTTRELLFAISQDPEVDEIRPQTEDLDEDLMLKWTRNLLHLDSPARTDWDDNYEIERGHDYRNENRVWRLAHQAVAEFLENSSCYNSGLAHCETGRVCLTILVDTFSAKAPQLWGSTDESFEYSEDAEYPGGQINSSEQGSHPELPDTLAEYAVYGWPTHVRVQENGLARNIEGLSRILRRFLGQPDEGGLAYKRWLKHAFSDLRKYSIPDWSVFESRPMPVLAFEEIENMAPTTLACHVGIYDCLLDWWSSSNIDHDRVRSSPRPWGPNIRWKLVTSAYQCFGWSLIAVACVHNETDTIKHLLGRKVRVNTQVDDEVPPIVAATVADSVKAVKDLIEFGADICSPFTYRHGHVLCFAIKSNSMCVMMSLLQQPGMSQVPEVEAILTSLGYWGFKSADAIALLLGAGVGVNTPLGVGTLLLAAAERGWEDMVRCLLEKGAEVNPQVDLGRYGSILEAAISSSSDSRLTVTLLINHGAHVNSKAVTRAWDWTLHMGLMDNRALMPGKEITQLLLECKPDMNETWVDADIGETSALIEAIRAGDSDHARLLFEHGAAVNLQVGGKYGDALDCVFQRTLDLQPWKRPYPIREVIDVLVEEGASLQNLEGDRLHTALAAAAFVGLEDMVQHFLDRGANPKTFCDHRYYTALGAAAASGHPRAPAVIHTLLNNGPDINTDYGFFQTARLALDGPLHNLILQPDWLNPVVPEKQRRVSWLESALALATHQAVWDIDFIQWKECLQLHMPEFWEQNSVALVNLQDILANNRARFFLEFPGAASHEDWSIKDAKDAEHVIGQRDILWEMSDILT